MGDIRRHPVWSISKEKFKEACEKSTTISGITRFLNLTGNITPLRDVCLKRIKEENIDISHIKRGFDWARGTNSKPPKEPRVKIENFEEIEPGKYKCPDCSSVHSKKGISTHYLMVHGDLKNFRPLNKFMEEKGNIAWNKGLTKEDHPGLVKQGQTFKQRIKEGKIIPSGQGRKKTKKEIKQISKNMKKAHSEGRAWNIGKSRWNNEPSYPEQFFQKVIENEFEDKNYKREFPLSIYSLDFAWEHKKRCIEIDGQQHERFQEYKDRDERKDKAIADAGWTVLRIPWIEMFHNPKHWIKVAREFINS